MTPNQFGNNMDLFGSMASWGAPQSAGSPVMDYASGLGLDWESLAPELKIQLGNDYQSQQLGQQQVNAFGAANPAPSGFAKGVGTFGTVMDGIGSLANIYLGLQGLKQQKEAFKFNKGVTNTNLNNSIMDYNRRLSDTLANRALNNGQGSGWVSEQLAKYSAKRS